MPGLRAPFAPSKAFPAVEELLRRLEHWRASRNDSDHCGDPAPPAAGAPRDEDPRDRAPESVRLGPGDDVLDAARFLRSVHAGRGDDAVRLDAGAAFAALGAGRDTLEADGYVERLDAGRGRDLVVLDAGGGDVRLGRGRDTLLADGPVERVFGGGGHDAFVLDRSLSELDVDAAGRAGRILLIDRLTGEKTVVRGVESFVFAGQPVDEAELRGIGARDAPPAMLVAADAQTVTVNDPDPTVSVIWDRVAQTAAMQTEGPVGPTLVSRAYALTHTAIYDAWAALDPVAVRVAFDVDGDNAALEAAAAPREQAEAMSHAAHTVLTALFPDMADLFDEVLSKRFGLSPDSDGAAARLGRDAAQDLLALRAGDGADGSGGYAPVNPGPLAIRDIARWTPESVPIDPEDAAPEQSFLTPWWPNVESFALPRTSSGETDFAQIRPGPPEPFFVPSHAGSALDLDAGTVTLAAPATFGGARHDAGETVPVSRDMIGPVVNPGFVAQAEEIVKISANLTDAQKLMAEFWEDGLGTPYPPGSCMTFAEYVSARDDHTLGEDARMFLAASNAVFDAGIAAWDAKTAYDYVRPVRAIRELGQLGLIGEWGVDAFTGEEGWTIEAFGGWDPDTGEGRPTSTILATNFVTYQRPGGDPSPPFAEYVSGHSSFSAAAAEVLLRFAGSDAFGASVRFEAGSSQFDGSVPSETLTLGWDTFSDAADAAGYSRRYGGIHFSDGDMEGRVLGREAGASAYELAERFWTGEAEDADRPFFTDDLLA